MPTDRSRHRQRHRPSRRRLRARVLRCFWRILGVAAVVLIGLGVYRLWELGLIPANQSADDWYDLARSSNAAVELPRDDAPHDDSIEWWYYNGHLTDAAGGKYGFHFTVFVINALTSHTVAHASLVDQAAGRHYTGQMRVAGNPSKGSKDGFDFSLGGWQMSGASGSDQLRFDLDGLRLDLHLQEATPAVMQGGNGILDFRGVGASYYYSRPRMDITGTLSAEGQRHKVSGTGWFDHQWGDFELFELGWDWFALQLDDGSDVMLYRLFNPKDGHPVLVLGTWSRNGVTTVLGPSDFQLSVTGHWVSPRTGRRYPMGWRLEIPAQAISVEVSPVMPDNELDARATTYLVYWEGPARISGSHTGQGYVELNGYGVDVDPPGPPPG